MAQTLITNAYRAATAQNFIESILVEESLDENNYYYVFAGNHQDYSNTAVPAIYDNVYDTEVDVYRNMIFGKLVKPTDVSLMINRVDYQSNISYAMYDDKDNTLSSKNFYVMIREGEYYNVFKCLNNNNGGMSTVAPSISSVGSDDIFYSPVDGYTWKYMYSVNFEVYDKFNTDKFIPLTVNNSVISSAVSGSIDAIKVEETGAGYSNYIQSAYFTVNDINLYSNVQYYGLSGASYSSSSDDFYKGCIIGIISGTGAGQYRIISSYEVTNLVKYIIIDTPFDIKPDNSSMYAIYPSVDIVGDQTETTKARAWAYINASGNTISRVEMIDRGSDYKIASATVLHNPIVGVTANASVRPILPPPGGNGHDPANELYCSTAAISVKFSASESNTIPTVNQFRQIGVVINPVFSKVTVNHSSLIGSFNGGETVQSFYPVRVQNHVNISAGNNYANAEYGGMFDKLTPNTTVYVTDESTYVQVFTVNNAVNSSVIQFKTDSIYDFSNATMYTLNVQATGTVESTSVGSVDIINISGHIHQNSTIIGVTSGAYSNTITSITINGVSKNFETFVEAYKYVGLVSSGSFDNNETVVQVTNNISNAVLHSVSTVGGISTFYFTNQNGIFNTSNTIIGANSGAIATLTDKYLPEIVFGSGKIVYLENLETPIIRQPRQTETFKLLFEF